MAVRDYITQGELNILEADFFSEIGRKAREFEREITRLEREVSEFDYDKYIFRRAFVDSANYVKDRLLDITMLEVRKAYVASKEYNYAPYAEHLERAVAIHQKNSNLVSITVDETNKDIYISVDFSPLGSIDQWAAIVKKVREELGVGKTKDSELRSHFWKEKIYGTARDGVRISRNTKSGESVDITANYVHKYPETIALRLSYLESDQAPYWYLINYGNVGNVSGDGSTTVEFHSEGTSAGIPYPIISPTYFVNNLEETIANLFYDVYQRFKDIAESNAKYLLNNTIDNEVLHATEFNDFVQELGTIVADDLEALKDFKVNISKWRQEIKKTGDDFIYVAYYSEYRGKPISYKYKRGKRKKLD